jgi:hypothetical protein
MSALSYDSYDSREDDLDEYEDQSGDHAPRRPRRQFFNRRSAALAALITCSAGFYAGVKIEKGHVSGSSSSFALPSLAAAGGTGARAAGGTTGLRSLPTGAGGLPGGLGASSNSSVGTVSSVNGRTLYVKGTSGDVIKVSLPSTAKITKSLTVSKQAVRPGDSVVIQGLKNSKGTLIAASVSDSGASSTASSSSSSATTSSSSDSGSSGVGSLFGGGSGG